MSIQDTAQKMVDAAQAEPDPFVRALLMAAAGEYVAQATMRAAAHDHTNGGTK